MGGEDALLRLYDHSRDEWLHLAGTALTRGTYDDDGVPALRQPFDGTGANAAPRELLTRSAFAGGVFFFLGHEDRATAVTFAPDGGSVFSASADGTLRRWAVTGATPGARLGPVHSFYFGLHSAASADGRWILFNHADRDARFHDRVAVVGAAAGRSSSRPGCTGS